MALKTYGARPMRFQLEENGEYFCIGSEVGNYLGFFRGTLYKRYPGMFRRSVTNDERKQLVKLGLNQYVPTSIVCLVRAKEVNDIIKGDDTKYKTAPIHSNEASASKKGKFKKSIPRMNLPSISHSNTIFQGAPIAHNTVYNKESRSSQMRFGVTDKPINLGTGAQQTMLVPMHSDVEIEGKRMRNTSTWNNNANGTTKRDIREDFNAITIDVDRAENTENFSEFEIPSGPQCRICLKSSDHFWKLFQNNYDLPQKIMAFASVQIEYGDGLPSAICFSCLQLLDMSYNFKCQIENSDLVSRKKLFNKMNINQDTVHQPLSQSLQNVRHVISNNCDNKRNLVSYQNNGASTRNGQARQYEEEGEGRNINNELDVERPGEEYSNSSESRIIPTLDGSQVFLQDQGGTMEKSIQRIDRSMEFESESIKQEEIMLPEDSDMSEGDNIDRTDNVRNDDLGFCVNNNLLLKGANAVAHISSEITQLESTKYQDSGDIKPLIPKMYAQKFSHRVESFGSNMELQTHSNIHGNKTALGYSCYWCEKQFSNIAEMLNHISNNHDSSKSRGNVDVDDNCVTIEAQKKVDHDISSKIDKQKIVGENACELKCGIFAKRYSYQEFLLSRIKTRQSQYKRSEAQNYHCKESKEIEESLEHQNHSSYSGMDESEDVDDLLLESLQCDRYGQLFATQGNLNRHIPTHSSLRFDCSTCRVRFSRLDDFKDHEQTKHTEEIFGSLDNKDDDIDN